MTQQRSPLPKALVDKLPSSLKLLCNTGRNVGHIDLAACTARGMIVAAAGGGLPNATAELTWGLILSSLRRQDARRLRLRAHRQCRRRLRQGLRHESARVGARIFARDGTRGRLQRGAQQGAFLRGVRCDFAAHAPGRCDARHRDGGGPRPDEAWRLARQYQPCSVDRAGSFACRPEKRTPRHGRR